MRSLLIIAWFISGTLGLWITQSVCLAHKDMHQAIPADVLFVAAGPVILAVSLELAIERATVNPPASADHPVPPKGE